MKYRWTCPIPPPTAVLPLAHDIGVSPLVAQCLLQRGFSTADAASQFLNPKLKNLDDPFALPNMRAAVDRLFQARAARHPIVLFGDYDVDGVASTALLLDCLGSLGWSLHPYLPHRLEEGYGLTRDALENCLRQSPCQLLLAVDCGSTAADAIAWLRERNIETIVLDHHQISNPPPNAVALVNPQLLESDSPNQPKALCSAGLAFKLAHAVIKHGRQLQLPGFDSADIRPYLDLVALATIADIVPLTGENRILVTAGLEKLAATQRPGLVALKTVSQCPDIIEPYHVGYQLAPRLNAAGRLETAQSALELLTAQTQETALPLAQALDTTNRQRQQIEKQITADAIASIRAKFNPERDYVLVEGQLLWHVGVVGIVAARVLREFYRPTLILGGDSAEWKGSGRSIAGFDLAAALRQCDDLLSRHGGHAMAAGVTVHPDNVHRLRERLNQIAHAWLQPEQLQPELRLDAETTLDDLSVDRVEELKRLGPFGQKNPEVQLQIRNVRLARPAQLLGREQSHLKLWVTHGREIREVVWWGAGPHGHLALPKTNFDVAITPTLNDYNGRRTLQLKLLDWRPSDGR